MRSLVAWRSLFTASLAFPLALSGSLGASPIGAASAPPALRPMAAHYASALTPAQIRQLSANANQPVIVLFRNQYAAFPVRGALRAQRLSAERIDQSAVVRELQQLRAPHLYAFHVINGVRATLSQAEITRLKGNPLVKAVVSDAVINGPVRSAATAPTLANVGAAALHAQVLPHDGGGATQPCTTGVSLAPEALQLTNALSATDIVTGAGVKVAFMAEGIDTTNPDFIRPDGSPVFVDYQDFTGDGTNAPTSAGESFIDASSIAAQGAITYDVAQPYTGTGTTVSGTSNAGVFVNPTRTESTCKIQIRGVAPGASLVSLKVFGQTNQSTNSAFVQAIEYAVDHGVDVLSQSFGGNSFPDNGLDPISLADDAAVAAGVTVIASSGDAGTAGTLGSPASDPNVLSVGATTQFRFYQEVGYQGFDTSNGLYTSNNISSLSSSGANQNNTQGVDVVAPGDLSWAVCTPDPALYSSCTDNHGNPAEVESSGGTSESAPLTAGEAALVIQAYRQSHGGVSPTPALVRQIIESTATDLNIASYEQGHGLINVAAAVQAAQNYNTTPASGTALASALVVSPTMLFATDAANTPETFNVAVTNSGDQSVTVTPTIKTLAAPFFSQTTAVAVNPSLPNFFVTTTGGIRVYNPVTVTLPAAADRLDVSVAYDTVSRSNKVIYLIVLDPQGTYTAYSLPQGIGNGYAHVDVRNPQAGAWTVLVATRKTGSAAFSGSVQLTVSESNFTTVGSTSGPITLGAGQSGTVQVTLPTPAQPSDLNATVALSTSDTSGATGSLAIPLNLRTEVPQPSLGGSVSFNGTLTGGNGRPGTGPQQTFPFTVPAGVSDLSLSVALTDTNYNLEGILVDPYGQPIDIQSTVTSLDPNTFAPNAYTNTMQFFRRDPVPGVYTFVLLTNFTVSGQQTSIPFSVALSYNTVSVQSAGVPTDPTTTVPQGSPATAVVTVTNTGNTTKDFFVDPRLSQPTLLPLGSFFPTQVTVPLTSGENTPLFYLPTEASQLVVAAEAVAPTAPISMDIYSLDGAGPVGLTFAPDVEATTVAPVFPGDYAVAAQVSAPEVVPGLWGAAPAPVGPFNIAALSLVRSHALPTPSTVNVGAVALALPFDGDAVPSSGDLVSAIGGYTPVGYTPLTLAPGQTGAITVTITPQEAPGTVISGALYVDAVNANSTSIMGDLTGTFDELRAVPYTYTVGEAVATSTPTATGTAVATSTPAATPTATGGTGQTPELGSADLLLAGLLPALALLALRRRNRRR